MIASPFYFDYVLCDITILLPVGVLGLAISAMMILAGVEQFKDAQNGVCLRAILIASPFYFDYVLCDITISGILPQ